MYAIPSRFLCEVIVYIKTILEDLKEQLNCGVWAANVREQILF